LRPLSKMMMNKPTRAMMPNTMRNASKAFI
jgi:hypothetical protein